MIKYILKYWGAVFNVYARDCKNVAVAQHRAINPTSPHFFKPFLFIVLSVVLLSCDDVYHNKDGNLKVAVDSVNIKASSAIKEVRNNNDTLNLALYYFGREMDANDKAYEYTLKYAIGHESKYYKLAHKYSDSVDYWYSKLKGVTKP